MMGQIDEWFFVSLAGIQTKTGNPGFQRLVIHPEVAGDLKYVKASYETLYGKVSVDWKREDKDFTLKINIPVNCTADVYLPGVKVAKEVGSGSYMFTKKL